MIGREEEKSLLRQIAEQDRSQFVVVYGRRRVGKTYLVRETFDYQFAFTHSGLEKGSLADQLAAFREALEDQGLENAPLPHSWIEAFGLLKKLLKQDKSERKIVFLDELPWMDTPKSKFVPALENFWNGWCSARKDIVLIVCGSATSWMIRKVLRNRGGLFNRANRTIYLQPFTLGQCEQYVRSLGLVMERREIVEGYMVFGGSPYYWSLLDARYSLAQNIDRLCFTTSGELSGEFKRLYASVFRKPEKHLKVVMALAAKGIGMTREEIVGETHLANTGALSTLLEELEESGFIRQYAPIGHVKKGAIYQLMDAFTIFYLAFMRSRPIERAGFWVNSVGKPGRLAWEGLAFERVCFWHEREIKRALGISGMETTTASWRSKASDPGAQIDMLIDRKDGIVNVCEIKFADGEYVISKAVAECLRSKMAAFKTETETRKAVHLTMITTFGLARSEYRGLAQSQITFDDLFAT